MKVKSAILYTLALLAQPAMAEDQPKVQNVNACSYEFNDDKQSQIRLVCEEAKAAEKAGQAQLISGSLHGVIAALCLTTCIWPWSQYACPIAGITGAVADAGITYSLTKDYAAATGSLASVTFGVAQLAMIPETVVVANQVPADFIGPLAEGQTRAAADTRTTGQKLMCYATTLLEVAQTAIKFAGASESKKLEKERYEEARRIALTKQDVKSLRESKPKFNTPALPGGSPGSLRETDTASSTGPTDCLGSGNANQIISCARSADPTIPDFVSTPEFQEAFKKTSGQELGNFLRNLPEGASPSQVMGAALANTGAGADVAANTQKYEKYFQDYQRNRGLAAYGGGGGGGGGGKPGKDMGQQMTDIMGDLLKKMGGEGDGGNAINPNVSQMRFGFAKQPADLLVQNRNVSLFDRINYRYNQSSNQVETWGWQSPYNRAIASQPIAPTSRAPASTAKSPRR